MKSRKDLILVIVASVLIVGATINWAVMLGSIHAGAPNYVRQAPEWEAVRIREDLPEADFLYVETNCPSCRAANENVLRMAREHPDQQFLIVNPGSVHSEALKETLVSTYEMKERKPIVPPILFGPSRMWVGVETVKEARLTPSDLKGRRPFERLGNSWDWIKTGREAMVQRLAKYQWHFVALAGLVDGINPCAISTIVFLLSYLTLSGMKRNSLAVGLLFAAGCFVTYFAVGLGLWRMSSMAGSALWGRRILYPLIALIAVFVALTAFLEFGKLMGGVEFDTLLRMPENWMLRVHEVIRKWVRARHVLLLAAPVAVVVTLIEFGCTGQVYLPTITYVASLPGQQLRVLPILLVYNVAFILPLLAVLVLHHFAARKLSTKDTPVPVKWVRLSEGIIMVVVAAFMLWSTYHAWL